MRGEGEDEKFIFIIANSLVVQIIAFSMGPVLTGITFHEQPPLCIVRQATYAAHLMGLSADLVIFCGVGGRGVCTLCRRKEAFCYLTRVTFKCFSHGMGCAFLCFGAGLVLGELVWEWSMSSRRGSSCWIVLRGTGTMVYKRLW